MKHLTPIIDLTQHCNMACSYCYAGSHQRDLPSKKSINDNFQHYLPLFFDFTDQIMEYNNHLLTSFVFHGGEPLLINLPNWREVLTYFRAQEYAIEIDLQTNGTLINDDYIKLFKEFGVKIGISCDGPKSFHDPNRKFRNGEGTFDRLFGNLERLKEAKLDFGCLVTLNKINLNAKALYNFFSKNNFAFNVRPIFNTSYSVPEELLISPTEYASVITDLFDLWFDGDQKQPVIDDFYNIIARFTQTATPTLDFATCPFIESCADRFVGYEMNGNLWPCNCFHNSDFLYGNISNSNLNDLMNSPLRHRLSTRWEKLKVNHCSNCEIAEYCFGGCPNRAFQYFGSYFAPDPFCQAYKEIIHHIYSRVQNSIENNTIKHELGQKGSKESKRA